MLKATITDRCKVWEINDKDGYAEVKFSTSRKIKEDSSYDKLQADKGIAKNGYISEYQSFVRFVGHAYNKLEQIKIGDTITNLVADFNREPYWDSNNECVAYPKNIKMTVFSFDIYDPESQNNNQNQNRNLDRAPQVAEDTQVNNTVNRPTVDTAEKPKASEECPF